MVGSPWRVFAAACAAISLATCGPTGEPGLVQGPSPPVDDARLERALDGLVPMKPSGEPQWEESAPLAERMRHYAVPGVGLAVIEGTEIAWAGGFGTVEAGTEGAVTGDTLFHAGSIAKCLSAAAALVLVGEGRLALDDDVNDDLISWRVPESELTATEKVTLRRLLSHSGGIRDGFTDRSSGDKVPEYFTPAGEGPSVTLQDLLDAAPGVDVDGPTRVTAVPGSRYKYANADYAILELLVRDVTGEPFAPFMARTVLEPLGMASSTYEQPIPEALRARAAVEHDLEGRPIAGDRLHIPLLAAGGLWTTPSDLARFALEIVHASRGESARLLPAGLVGEMLTPQVEIPENPLAEAAGLGFELAGQGDGFYLVHTGGTWGSTAVLWVHPVTGQGAVIMTNSASGSLLRFEILLAVAREYGWPIET